MYGQSRSNLSAFVVVAVLVAACGSTSSPQPAVSPPMSLPASSSAATQLPPLADVPFYRANSTANGIDPGPGPTGKPELAWRGHVGHIHLVPNLTEGKLI